MIKEIFKRALFYLSVPKCVFCEEPLDYTDKCFCKSCRAKYEEWKREIDCSRCANILSRCSCSKRILMKNNVNQIFKLYKYRAFQEDIPGKRIIYSLKEDYRSDVFDFLAEELAEAIDYNLKIDKNKLIITNVPRRQKAISQFGYDHAAELAKRVAKILGVRYVSILKSKAKKPQKGRTDRRKNAKFVLKHGDWSFLKGHTVLIVDDIITSGSSVLAASEIIKNLGVRKRMAACIAMSYKDYYQIPFKRELI